MEIKKLLREEFDKLEDKATNFYEIFEGNNKVSYYYGNKEIPYKLGNELSKGIGIQHLYICNKDRFDSLSEIDNSSIYLVLDDKIKLVYGGMIFIPKEEVY